MTAKEIYLYHQIYPAKLATDFAAAFMALYPLWQHWLLAALLVILAPPSIASLLVIRYADLEPYKRSAFGRYTARYMNHAMAAVRLLGMLVVALRAWFHSPSAIIVGFVTIVLAWLRGFILPPWRN
jgi:hypothetical protein